MYLYDITIVYKPTLLVPYMTTLVENKELQMLKVKVKKYNLSSIAHMPFDDVSVGPNSDDVPCQM